MLDEKLAELLKRVQKPGRYVGGEWNVVTKEEASVKASLALCYPDVYEAAMASLGVHLLYDVVNRDQRFSCERAFLPWVDMAAEMRREGLPLFTLDGRRDVADFDVVGFFWTASSVTPTCWRPWTWRGFPLGRGPWRFRPSGCGLRAVRG